MSNEQLAKANELAEANYQAVLDELIPSFESASDNVGETTAEYGWPAEMREAAALRFMELVAAYRSNPLNGPVAY